MAPSIRNRASVAGGELQFVIDGASFTRIMRGAKEFDADLAKATRKRLRDAAKPAIADIKRELLSIPVKRDVGLRRGLAAGTRLSIRTGRRGGVLITTSGAKLPAGKQGLARVFNQPSFRHPVFAHPEGERNARTRGARMRHRLGISKRENDWVWVRQSGHPYFHASIERHAEAMREAMMAALDDALQAIAGD